MKIGLLKVMIFLALTSFWGNAAQAETWVGRCGNVHVKFDRKALKAGIYLQTNGGTFQIATGKIVFDNGAAMRAPMEGIQDGPMGPMSEIGLNKSRKVVYVLYRNPNTGQVKDGVLCESPITVEP
jgi:hypothetical protein